MVDQVNLRVRDKPVEQRDLLDTVNREILPQLERLRKTLNALLALTITEVEGDPDGVLIADQGAVALRKDGGAGTTLYVKESGGIGEDATATGWVAK